MSSKLNQCPMYKGLVIPAVVGTDENGRPEFATLNGKRTEKFLHKRRCSVCGWKLSRQMWFLGLYGVQSGGKLYPNVRELPNPPRPYEVIFSLEPGLHFDCMLYAKEHCPHLKGDGGPTYVTRDYRVVPNPFADGRVARLDRFTEYVKLPGKNALVSLDDMKRAAALGGTISCPAMTWGEEASDAEAEVVS